MQARSPISSGFFLRVLGSGSRRGLGCVLEVAPQRVAWRWANRRSPSSHLELRAQTALHKTPQRLACTGFLESQIPLKWDRGLSSRQVVPFGHGSTCCRLAPVSPSVEGRRGRAEERVLEAKGKERQGGGQRDGAETSPMLQGWHAGEGGQEAGGMGPM